MKEKIIHPPTVFAVSILLMTFFHFYFPVFKVVPPELKNMGLILIISGIFLAFWQFFTMKGRTPIPYGSKPKTLITNGPFKYTRNAFYVCIVLISAGAAVILREITSFIIVAVEFYIFDRYLIPPEEKVLEDIFGQKYKDYKKKVGRWI